MTALSQRDTRWSNLPLGTSALSLGSHGCTVTALAMIIGTTPDIVNSRLNSVGGFKDGSLVIWNKIQEAFPGITVKRVFDKYDNEDVLSNLPAIVQVDGTPIGATMHFVVYIGNQELIDPWDGQIKPTSTYNAVSYALVKGEWKQNLIDPFSGLDLSNPESMRVAATIWKRYVNGELIERSQVTECQTQLGTALELNRTLSEQNTTLQESIKSVQSKYETEQERVSNLKREIEAIYKEDADYGEEALAAQRKVGELRTYIKMFADKLQTQYDPTDDKATVEKILQEIVFRSQIKQEPLLPQFLEPLIQINMNDYLAKNGFEPIDVKNLQPEDIAKVRFFIEKWTEEFLAYTNNQPAPTDTPMIDIIKKPQPSFIKRIWGMIFVTE